jgi:hypothetical protein
VVYLPPAACSLRAANLADAVASCAGEVRR